MATSRGRRRRLHAQRRAKERYGITLNKDDLEDIVLMVEAEKAGLVRRQTSRRSVWDVFFRDQIIRIVYDPEERAVVTLLPRR